MSKYLVVIEKAGRNYSAFCPDMPGCVATGATRKEVVTNIREALSLHLEGLRQEGARAPKHSAEAKYVLV